MTAECLGETGMSLKTKLTIVRGTGQLGRQRGDHTQEEESHNWKKFKWMKGFVHYLNPHFSCFKKS